MITRVEGGGSGVVMSVMAIEGPDPAGERPGGDSPKVDADIECSACAVPATRPTLHPPGTSQPVRQGGFGQSCSRRLSRSEARTLRATEGNSNADSHAGLAIGDTQPARTGPDRSFQ